MMRPWVPLSEPSLVVQACNPIAGKWRPDSLACWGSYQPMREYVWKKNIRTKMRGRAVKCCLLSMIWLMQTSTHSSCSCLNKTHMRSSQSKFQSRRRWEPSVQTFDKEVLKVDGYWGTNGEFYFEIWILVGCPYSVDDHKVMHIWLVLIEVRVLLIIRTRKGRTPS